MDPFTEVRDSAGAVNHDPRPRSLSACGPPAASVARAHSERAAWRKPRGRGRPGFAAPSLALGKAGKTGPQKPHANPELCNRLAFLHSPKCWLRV